MGATDGVGLAQWRCRFTGADGSRAWASVLGSGARAEQYELDLLHGLVPDTRGSRSVVSYTGAVQGNLGSSAKLNKYSLYQTFILTHFYYLSYFDIKEYTLYCLVGIVNHII